MALASQNLTLSPSEVSISVILISDYEAINDDLEKVDWKFLR